MVRPPPPPAAAAEVMGTANDSHVIQHIRDINVGGVTISPGAVGKRPARHCKIVQKIAFFGR